MGISALVKITWGLRRCGLFIDLWIVDLTAAHDQFIIMKIHLGYYTLAISHGRLPSVAWPWHPIIWNWYRDFFNYQWSVDWWWDDFLWLVGYGVVVLILFLVAVC